MSGAAGGSRINKEDLKATIRDYRDNILKPLGLDKSYSITGVRSRPEKTIFGDIDIVVSFPEGGDKKELKQELASFLSQTDKIPTIPHKKNNKYFIHGNIVSTLYPIIGKEGEYVQIDNIITVSKEEGQFTYNMLDLPAQEQTLAIGLAKTIFTELDKKQVEKLFKELGIINPEKPGEGEEYDFNLNPSELSLIIVPIGQNNGREIWKSNKFDDIKKLTLSLGIDIKKDKFDDIISKIKKFKNRRSIDRLKGMFAKNIRVGDAEKGIEKGIKKQQALDTVAALENKYNPLVMGLIKPFILEETTPSQTIALMPGAFKPPHRDHLRRINAAAKNSDKAIILISPLDRIKEGEIPISAKQSLAIWQLYKDKGVLAPNVEFFISQDNAPVKTAYDIASANPNNQYIGVYGKDDVARWKNLPNEKYPNLTASDFNIIADLSASDLRRTLLNGGDITPFLPNGITPEEYKQALGIKPPNISEAKSNNDDNYKKILLYIDKILNYCCEDLQIKRPKVIIINNDKYTQENHSFGGYMPGMNEIYLVINNRNLRDICVTLSHECFHSFQDKNNLLKPGDGKDGDNIENDANAYAGKTMRKFGRENPEIFKLIMTKNKYGEENELKSNKLREEYTQYALNELFEKDLPNIEKLNELEYLVGNGIDIEAKYYFRAESLSTGWWSIHWNFTKNNINTSQEAWKQVTATSYKIIQDFIKTKKPSKIEISGNTPEKTNIYKSKSYLEKLENIFNNQYSLNISKYKVDMELIEILAKNNIKKRIETLNETYDQALNYWQNGDLNSNSKIERWDTIKRKIKREILQKLYNIN